MSTVRLEAAERYVAQGRKVIRVDGKRPVDSGWPNGPLPTIDTLRAWYGNGQQYGMGIVLGVASHDLIDVDLDCQEAIDLAPHFLPETGSKFGRDSKPRSHWLYTCQLPEGRVTYSLGRGDDLDREMVVEIRGTGHQTIVPPSIHPSGEAIRYDENGEPAAVDAEALVRAVRHLAIASVLLRYWPRPGTRHDFALAVAGGLLRGGLGSDEVLHLLDAVATAAGDEETRDRLRAIDTTSARLANGGKATGWPKVKALLGPGGELVVDRLREWLGASYAEPAVPAPVEAPWPEPLAPEAFYGLAGDVVDTIEPHTEADRAALLLHFLSMVGNVAGRGPHFWVESTRHGANLFVLIVGDTSRSRKGTAKDHISRLLRPVDESWRSISGLASGEGLIWNVRDAIETRHPVKEGGHVVRYEAVESDPGVTDKRLLVVESEFARVLRVIGREGCTLSEVTRDAWDRDRLQSATKNSPAIATEPHVSIIGHITADELRRYCTDTEIMNGFMNRFLVVCVRRSKLLPDGARIDDAVLTPLRARIQAAISFARQGIEYRRDEGARPLWHAAYSRFPDAGGLFGAVTARASAQVVRLSIIYALLDRSPVVREVHLRSALAVWEYCEASCRYLFGHRLGDPIVDSILGHLRAAGERGLLKSELWGRMGHHARGSEMDRGLAALEAKGLIWSRTEGTGGRSGQRFGAVLGATGGGR